MRDYRLRSLETAPNCQPPRPHTKAAPPRPPERPGAVTRIDRLILRGKIMSTARTLRPRVDFGTDDHDGGGALSCLPCCRPDEILHSLVGAPVPPPDARQAVSAHVEEAFSLFAELNEFAGGLPRLPSEEIEEFLFMVARRSYPAGAVADIVTELEPDRRCGLSVEDCQKLLDELRRRDSGMRGRSTRNFN